MEYDEDILHALRPEVLLAAYLEGIFPMVQDGELWWFRPDPRGLMPLDERFHVSRRLRRTVRAGRYVCTRDRAFRAVVRCCARRHRPSQVWISPEIEIAYTHLHELGFAHSVEAWAGGSEGRGEPVGGLYGVAIGGAFFAESMFHTARDAGKVALVHCVEHLRQQGFAMMDVQWTTENLKRFGAYELPDEDYRTLLAEAASRPVEY
ncbi:MAG: leucyl/phenylalanyl-tRNA--protein transferase [Phycisphaerae bacterium]